MTVIHPLLSRRPASPPPAVSLLPEAPELSLAQGRVHEACGLARRTFATWLAARVEGPVFWIAPQWMQDRPNAEGLCQWVDPARFIFVTPGRREDLLWCLEEVLRSGAAALGIADLTGLPGLTPVRRLHLAAETGGQLGPHHPLGLLLTPGQGGAAGVETRWHMRPGHDRGADRWHLDRARARTAPPNSWVIDLPEATQPPRIKTA